MEEVSWVKSMLLHHKEASEFRLSLLAIQPIMTDPEASRDEKRSTLNMMVNALSDKAFKLKPIVGQIMTIINMKEDVCQEYADSEAQVEGILGWLPRFQEHRGILLEEVKKHREIHGLKV